MVYNKFKDIAMCNKDCIKKSCYILDPSYNSQRHSAASSLVEAVDFDAVVKKRRENNYFCKMHKLPRSVDSIAFSGNGKFELIEFKHINMLNLLKNGREMELQEKVEHSISMLAGFIEKNKIQDISFRLVYLPRSSNPQKEANLAKNAAKKIEVELQKKLSIDNIVFDSTAISSKIFDKKSYRYTISPNNRKIFNELVSIRF